MPHNFGRKKKEAIDPNEDDKTQIFDRKKRQAAKLKKEGTKQTFHGPYTPQSEDDQFGHFGSYFKTFLRNGLF